MSFHAAHSSDTHSTSAHPHVIENSDLLVIDDNPVDVLIIDDDFSIRTMLEALLADSKYTFQSAPDGRSALGLLAQRRFRLVVTDLYMPKMDGFEVISRYIAADPAAMILTISGGGGGAYDRELALKSSQLLGSFRTLPKPFTSGQFLQAMEEMIGPPAVAIVANASARA